MFVKQLAITENIWKGTKYWPDKFIINLAL